MVSDLKKFTMASTLSDTSVNLILTLTLFFNCNGKAFPRQRGSQVTGTQPGLMIKHGLKGFQTGASVKALI